MGSTMSRTCIICGVAANSREHVFPAALGGRRTNKGIYCEKHNEAYSGLAEIIADQLRFFNAQLGVVGDHQKATGEVKPVLLIDPETNGEVRLSDSSISYVSPRIFPVADAEDGGEFVLAANSPQEAQAFIATMQKPGHEIRIKSVGAREKYYPGTLTGKLELGGNGTGLRAITYIAQTFLAHTFPDLARLPEMAGVKNYTLNGSGADFAWWHAPVGDGLDAVRKPFSHRIIVGHNADDGVVYARLSLFSALHYGVNFGVVPTTMSRSVVFDIDPLVKYEPHDVQKTEYQKAVGYVEKPSDLTEHLAAAITSGQAQASISSLMRRITDHQRALVATKWLQELERASPTDRGAADTFFERLVSEESGRVLMLLQAFKRDFIEFNAGKHDKVLTKISENFVQNPDRDPESRDGLSPRGRALLEIASSALKQQLTQEFLQNQLDQDRMERLLGGGLGQHAVGMVALEQAVLEILGESAG
ncbi:hypothetical protein CD58_18355 [Pseudomonas brassicacearum]|nr:hypothetical protein CD58_18355 [Pseudomonas brassicacearum]